MKIAYGWLCIVGTVLPLLSFMPWLAAHGLNLPLMVQQIAASTLSAFAWLDVLVAALAVIAFVLYEGWRLRMSRAWLALPGLCVGVSLALPLFLWMREGHMQQQGPSWARAKARWRIKDSRWLKHEGKLT